MHLSLGTAEEEKGLKFLPSFQSYSVKTARGLAEQPKLKMKFMGGVETWHFWESGLYFQYHTPQTPGSHSDLPTNPTS